MSEITVQQPPAATAMQTSSGKPVAVTDAHLTPRKGDAPDTACALDTRIDAFYYGKKKALRDVYLKVPRNKITAFIGPSG